MPRWNNKNCGFQKGHKDFGGLSGNARYRCLKCGEEFI